jgi:putative transport protein
VQPLIEILSNNPLLTLFLVAGLGFTLGKIKIAGVSIGVAAVLFVGLGVGALDATIALPDVILSLGLVIFVYTIGLSSGPGFIVSFKKRGIATTLLTWLCLMVTAGIWYGASRMLSISPEIAVGGFTGSLSNTAALAAVMEMVKGSSGPGVGYAITYPMGVVSLLVCMVIYANAKRKTGTLAPPAREALLNRTIRVSNPEVVGQTIHEIMEDNHFGLVFGRIKRGDSVQIAESSIRLELGDLITAVGPESHMVQAIKVIGEDAGVRLELDRTEYDYRRIVVSNPMVFGLTLAELNLPQKYDAVMTRLQRGEVEILPDGGTILEPGDRVRIVTHRDNMTRISKYLGDSYRALSEIDILSFALGIALGLLIGLIPVHLPGGLVFKLGNAGGPLVVALVLGALHRTGPINWSLPYSANLTLRQIGLVFFLAAVGVKSGFAFREALATGAGVTTFLVGAVATAISASIFLGLGSKIFKVSGATMMGMVSGVHTQPAALGFSIEETKSDQPNVGYASVFPVASVSKIILAQILLQILS